MRLDTRGDDQAGNGGSTKVVVTIIRRDLGEILSISPVEGEGFARVRSRRRVRAVACPSDLQNYVRRVQLRPELGLSCDVALDERLRRLGIVGLGPARSRLSGSWEGCPIRTLPVSPQQDECNEQHASGSRYSCGFTPRRQATWPTEAVSLAIAPQPVRETAPIGRTLKRSQDLRAEVRPRGLSGNVGQPRSVSTQQQKRDR